MRYRYTPTESFSKTVKISLITICVILFTVNTCVINANAQSGSVTTGPVKSGDVVTGPYMANCQVQGACSWWAKGSSGNVTTGPVTSGSVTPPPLIPPKVIPPLDVVTLPYEAPVSVDTISTHIIKIPNDDTSRVRLAVTNTGDAVYNSTANVFPGLQSPLGINGLTPSAISSPNIPQPLGIVGHSTFYLGELPANGIKEFDVNVYPTVAGTVELPVQLTYNNGVGTRVNTPLVPVFTVFRQVSVYVIPQR